MFFTHLTPGAGLLLHQLLISVWTISATTLAAADNSCPSAWSIWQHWTSCDSLSKRTKRRTCLDCKGNLMSWCGGGLDSVTEDCRPATVTTAHVLSKNTTEAGETALESTSTPSTTTTTPTTPPTSPPTTRTTTTITVSASVMNTAASPSPRLNGTSNQPSEAAQPVQRKFMSEALWSQWSACSHTCGRGVRTRHKLIDHNETVPTPRHATHNATIQRTAPDRETCENDPCLSSPGTRSSEDDDDGHTVQYSLIVFAIVVAVSVVLYFIIRKGARQKIRKNSFEIWLRMTRHQSITGPVSLKRNRRDEGDATTPRDIPARRPTLNEIGGTGRKNTLFMSAGSEVDEVKRKPLKQVEKRFREWERVRSKSLPDIKQTNSKSNIANFKPNMQRAAGPGVSSSTTSASTDEATQMDIVQLAQGKSPQPEKKMAQATSQREEKTTQRTTEERKTTQVTSQREGKTTQVTSQREEKTTQGTTQEGKTAQVTPQRDRKTTQATSQTERGTEQTTSPQSEKKMTQAFLTSSQLEMTQESGRGSRRQSSVHFNNKLTTVEISMTEFDTCSMEREGHSICASSWV